MKEIIKYESFDGLMFVEKDVCLTHEKSILEQAVLIFEEGLKLDFSAANIKKYATLIYVMPGAEKAFEDWLGVYLNSSGWFKVQHFTDENFSLTPFNKEMRECLIANEIVEEAEESMKDVRKKNERH